MPLPAKRGRWPRRAEGFASRLAGAYDLGCCMKFFNSLFASDSGSSSAKLAVMIGLSSSMVLVLARIGVAMAGQ